jgi:hypothetical protein
MRPQDGQPPKDPDKAEIDRLVEAFFRVFRNQGGAVPGLESLHGMFIKAGLIIKTCGPVPEISNVQQFIEPRKAILNDGTLREFIEEEVLERTAICGNIAQRISFYRKSGILSGQPFQGRGVKTFQLIRTTAGWKLSSVAWDDEREGFALPGDLGGCAR